MMTAPDFKMMDSEGKEVTLSQYRDNKRVVLIFNRGFSCQYCRRHMGQLRQDYQKFIERDTEVIAVGSEDTAPFSYFWRQERMPFIGIPDCKHSVANLFGQKVDQFKLPSLIIIDKSGKIRFRHFGNSMSDIPTNDEVLSLLDQLSEEFAQEVQRSW